MNFGEMIGAGRREQGFSQEELAEILDRDAAVISQWEAGLEVPSSPTAVMELAAALQLEPDVLLAAVEEADVPDTAAPDDESVEEPDDSEPDEAGAADTADEADEQEEPDDPAATLGSKVVTRSSGGSAPSLAQVAVARAQMPAPPPSYMDDAKLMRLYRMRLIATTVVGIILLWLFFWALGNTLEAVGVLWDSLRPGGGGS